MTTATQTKPRILLLGEPVEGSFEREIYDFLRHNKRFAECRIQSKNSASLQDEVRDSDLIVMFCPSQPQERREGDVKLLQYLRDREDELLLFAENRDDLLDTIDKLGMRANVFKLTSETDRQRRLLQAILEWKAKRDALVVEMEKQAATQRTSESDEPKPKPKQSNELLGFLRREVIGVLAAAIIAAGGYWNREKLAHWSESPIYTIKSVSAHADVVDEQQSVLVLGGEPTLTLKLEGLPALVCNLTLEDAGSTLKVKTIGDGDGAGDKYDVRRAELARLLFGASFQVTKNGADFTRLENVKSTFVIELNKSGSSK